MCRIIWGRKTEREWEGVETKMCIEIKRVKIGKARQ